MIMAGLASLLALACGGSDGGSTENSPPGDIEIGNNFFDPTSLPVTVGKTVTWAWKPGDVTHNVTFDDGAPGSGDKSSGTFQRTFNSPGTFTYHCSIHGAAVMSGSITVTSTGDGTGSGGGTGGDGGGGSNGGYDPKS
jgi:plastocyanin